MHPLNLSIRIDPANPDHHLWNNHGTWWCHYTLHRGPRKQRCRVSLETGNVVLARARRDALFAALRKSGAGPALGALAQSAVRDEERAA